MLTTTPRFREQMHADEREIKALVEINFRPGDTLFTTNAVASSQLNPQSAPSMSLTNRLKPQSWHAEGDILDYMKPATEGWRSLGLSGPEGLINEWLSVTYNKKIKMDRVWFSSFIGYTPMDFTIDVYTTKWENALTVTGNMDTLFVGVFTTIFEASQVRINITRMATSDNNVRILSFGIPARLLLGEDDVEDFTLLEEASGEGSNPLGTVTANEFTMTVNNAHRWFTPANLEGPFVEFLRPGVQMRPLIGVKTKPDTFEFIPLGLFRTTDWEVPSESLSAGLTGLDRIYDLAKKPAVKLPVMEDVTIAYLFSILFRAYGLARTEYLIDASLNQKVALGWIPKGNMLNALQELSAAGNCSVTTDRHDRILVRNNFNVKEVSERYTEDAGVMSLQNPISYLKTYSAVKVSYKIPSVVATSEELLNISSIVFPPGVTILKDMEYQQGPVKQINSVLFGASHANLSVKAIRTGAWLCDIEVNNPGWEPVETSMVISGAYIKLISTDFTTRLPTSMQGVNVYEFSSDLIQDARIANVYGNVILTLLQDPSSRYFGEVRGNPSMEVYDTIELRNLTDKVANSAIVPTRIELTYDGGLTMMVDGRKPVRPTQQVFLGPALNIKVPIPMDAGYYT